MPILVSLLILTLLLVHPTAMAPGASILWRRAFAKANFTYSTDRTPRRSRFGAVILCASLLQMPSVLSI